MVETWIAEGWIHPRLGGSDYQFIKKFGILGTFDEDLKAKMLIRRVKGLLKRDSFIVDDFVVYKKGGKKYSARLVK